MERKTLSTDDVRKYNNRLKEIQTKYNQLQIQLNYQQQELDKRCRELSGELGEDVNPSNVKNIYEREMTKIQADMEFGEKVLDDISEKLAVNSR